MNLGNFLGPNWARKVGCVTSRITKVAYPVWHPLKPIVQELHL